MDRVGHQNALFSFDADAGLNDGVFTAVDGPGSSLSMFLEDDMLGILDTVQIFGDTDWDFELKLEMTQVMAGLGNGPGGWTGAGRVKWTDLDGHSIDGSVIVNQVYIDSAKNLYLVGSILADAPATGSLLFGGDPFTFRGHSDWGFVGEDGTANQITVLDPDNFDNATLTTIKVYVGDLTVDEWFGEDRGTAAGQLLAGEVKGAVTPAPAAALLAAIGLLTAARRQRRSRRAS